MKKIVTFCFVVALSLCTLLSAVGHSSEISKALKKVPASQRAGLEFLIDNMPAGDLDTLSSDFLLEELQWAYKARKELPWCAELPDSIFFNDVLPYASMDESREPWREMFWAKFYPLVKDLKDVRVAIDTINKAVKDLVGVEYNTKRRRPNQSPRESMAIGMASCSGLSIILTDVFRAMGIPSRIAGTPLWVSKEGNHNWSEVWIDGKWYFTEYYPNASLNKSWFLDRAGKADKSDPIYWMYATSWKSQPGGQHFPMVWARTDKSVPGVVVTDFYIDLYNAEKAAAKKGFAVSFKMYGSADGGRASGDRVASDVKIVDGTGNIVAVGTTRGTVADMNDYLTLYLPTGDMKVEYKNGLGEVVSIPLAVEADRVVELFYR